MRNGHYAFLEMNERLLGEDGWRLWSLTGPDTKAVLLDQRDGPPMDGRPSALFVLTDETVVWSVVHDRHTVPTFELHQARFDGSGDRTLLSTPFDKGSNYWDPSIDAAGTHLLYSTIDPSANGSTRFRIWSLDLTHRGAKPVRLGDTDDAVGPVSNGRTLAWRNVADGNPRAASNSLVVSGMDGSDPRTIVGNLIFDLSIGRRFVAIDSNDLDLVLYDTEQHRAVSVERHAPKDGSRFQRGWTVVAGDLLVYHRGYLEGSSEPGVSLWARLPGPGE